MKNLVMDYAKKNKEFDTALNELKKTYETEDVSDEVLADISGQLLGNQDFILNLSTKKPNIFKKMYDKIISIANKITGNSKEKWFIKDLKNKWEEAYRTQNNNLNKKENFSVIYNSDGTFNRVKINDNIFEKSDEKSISKTIHQYIKNHVGEIYTIIESGQKVYLGKDLPNEFAYSKSSKSLSTANKMAKGRTSSNFKEIIENANNRNWEKNKKSKHNKDAKYGFYRYDTTFSFDYKGKEKIYNGTILIRNDANGKKYLYDILKIQPQKKSVNLPPVASNSNKSSAINGGSSNQLNDNISQSDTKVKSNTSSTVK